MSREIDQGASGKMILMDYFYESGSTHYDKSKTITLEASTDGKKVELIQVLSENNVYKPRTKDNIEKYIISVETLINFIKDNGTKL